MEKDAFMQKARNLIFSKICCFFSPSAAIQIHKNIYLNTMYRESFSNGTARKKRKKKPEKISLSKQNDLGKKRRYV